MIGPMDIYVDLFAGGGGTSCGFEMAMGFSPDIAINHNPEAVAMHAINHPETRHYITDIWEVNPTEVCAGRPVGMLWASPDCTHFSRAKGGKPKSHKIRSLAWVIIRWAREVHPKVIMMENVPEFQTWGPLDEEGQPIKAFAGETFEQFKAALREMGYRVEHRELTACDYGAPTIRKRFFLIARCDGDQIIWPKKTNGIGTGKPYRTAAECIDWTIVCPSIYARDKPLVEKTLKRINKGIVKFVIQNPHPYIVKSQAPFLIQYHSEQTEREVRGQVINAPLMVVDGSPRYALCAVFLDKYYGNEKHGAAVDAPAPTVTGADRMSLIAVNIAGEDYEIKDIGMRMLQPRELFRAQGFPDSYIIDFEYNGKPMSKKAQVKMAGNSVCPPVAAALIGANCKEASRERKVA